MKITDCEYYDMNVLIIDFVLFIPSHIIFSGRLSILLNLTSSSFVVATEADNLLWERLYVAFYWAPLLFLFNSFAAAVAAATPSSADANS